MTSQESWSDLWRKNLGPDEEVIWSGTTSEELRLGEIGRKRQIALAVLAVSLGTGLILGWNLAHPPVDQSCAAWNCSATWFGSFDPYRLLLAPGIFVCGIVALFAIFGLFPETQRERVYALTTTRLLACDGRGVILDQLSIGEVAWFRWKGGIASAVVEARRKDDPEITGKLIIKNVAEMAGLEKALASLRLAA